jgi:hypothetical protein
MGLYMFKTMLERNKFLHTVRARASGNLEEVDRGEPNACVGNADMPKMLPNHTGSAGADEHFTVNQEFQGR